MSVLKLKLQPKQAPEVQFLTTVLFIKQRTRAETVLKVEHHTKIKAWSLLWEKKKEKYFGY